MFESFLSVLIVGFISLIIIYFFLWLLIRIMFNKFMKTNNGLCSLQTDLCFLKERIQKLLDELEKTSQNKNINDISEEREDRWNRIRKAFEKKEKEQDGSR